MFTICRVTVTCLLISLLSCETYAAEDRGELAFPQYVVDGVEWSASHRGISPTALLLLDLGNVLKGGSFTSNSNLLSLPPPDVDEGEYVHFGLWQALAAPFKIVVFVSQRESSESSRFFTADFVQNIRHKFMYVLFTRTEAQDRLRPYDLGIFPLPTFVLIGRHRTRAFCYENRDNLFWELSPKTMAACATAATACDVLSFSEPFTAFTGAMTAYHKLLVKCNMTGSNSSIKRFGR